MNKVLSVKEQFNYKEKRYLNVKFVFGNIFRTKVTTKRVVYNENLNTMQLYPSMEYLNSKLKNQILKKLDNE